MHPSPPDLSDITSLLNFRYSTLLAGTLGGRFQDVTEEEVFLSVWLKLWAIIVDRVSTESLQSTYSLASLLHSHWSSANNVLLSLVEIVRSVALPALLCHREPALVGGFGCLELVLYGIRVLAEQFLESNLDTEWIRLDRGPSEPVPRAARHSGG